MSNSVSNQHGVRILIRLGLTLCQAKVYIALAQSGTSTAKTISKVSMVARPDIYRIMLKLQELGLAEKVIITPTKFKATPIQEVITILMDQKTKETYELRLETKEFLKKFKTEVKPTIQAEENQFILIPRKKAAINKRKKEIDATKKSIDCLISFKRLESTAKTCIAERKKALERGVKIRVVTEKPENEKSIPKIIQDFNKYPSFRVRYLLDPPSAILTIYDRKELLITTSAKPDRGESPALWSNNPSLLSVINDFYEILWITAMENPHEEP